MHLVYSVSFFSVPLTRAYVHRDPWTVMFNSMKGQRVSHRTTWDLAMLLI